MAKDYTLNDIGRMLESILDKLSPKNTAEWVSGYDLRTRFGLKKSEIERYKLTGLMRTKSIKPGSNRLLYDISKVKHLL